MRLTTLLASLALASSLLGSSVPAASAAPHVVTSAAKADSMRARVRAKLAERRKVTFERFLAYREARVYPVNMENGFQHVWVDNLANLCAAATLISHDWGRDAALAVGHENNQLALASVTEGPLLDWMLTSGMTQAEIVAIQVPGFQQDGAIRVEEVGRMYGIYVDVERQLRGLDKHNLDLAVDALMKRPALAKQFLAGQLASAGKYGKPPTR